MDVGHGPTVSIDRVKPFELHHAAFMAGAPTTIEIEATGSVERDHPDASVATQVWILSRDDRSVVWRLAADTVARRRGTLLRTSTLASIDAGTYDLYFASFGNDIRMSGPRNFIGRLFRSRPDWEEDSRRWNVSVRSHERNPRLVRLDDGPAGLSGDDIFWRAAPMSSRSGDRAVFEVKEPMEVRVYSIGELSDEGRDYGWIDNLSTRARIWELKIDNTTHAGGHFSNRVFDNAVRLEPGVYAAGFETDPAHAPDNWRANPPFDPTNWGLTILRPPEFTDAIGTFDPWEARSPLFELIRIGSSQHDMVEFEVAEPMDVVVDALGELSPSRPYDYGWIENEDGNRIWQMQYSNSTYAGGDRYNRSAIEIFRLEPGRYAAHFQTDDSHASGDWRKGKPRFPDRWGMALFPVDPELPAQAFNIIQRLTNLPEPEPPVAGIPLPNIPQLPHLPDLPQLPPIEHLRRHLAVQLRGVGNDADLRERFRVGERGKVIVVAQGEILPTERYDYAWIERADNGEMIWSMTWENTHPAGGDDRNRSFVGAIELPEGEYVVRYRSDLAHAFGDFGKIAPNDPENWGITVIVPPGQ